MRQETIEKKSETDRLEFRQNVVGNISYSGVEFDKIKWGCILNEV
jgi:hypothetical protein